MNFATRSLLELQETTLLAARAFRGIFKRPRYIQEAIDQMDAIGVGSLTIIILTGFFTGGVLTVQTFPTLKSYGAQSQTGYLVAVSLELRRPDTRDRRQLREAARPPAGDLRQRRIVEDHVRRHLLGPRPGQAPSLQRLEPLGPLLGRSRATRQLRQEPARLLHPGDRQHVLGPRQADVEEAPLLGDRVRRLRLPHRQLLLLHTCDEHRLELKPLRAVERQEVDATSRLALPPNCRSVSSCNS